MIEFVVIFLVVLSCSGVLFIVLLFLPKAFPFVKDWVSRISSSYADWKQERRREAKLEWEREKREAEELRRCEERLERERRRREQSHLLWRWDFVALLASVCGLLIGMFLRNSAITEHDFLAIPSGLSGREYLVAIDWFHSVRDELEESARFWGSVSFLSLIGVLVFGALFCRRYFSAEIERCLRYFSAEARLRRRVDYEERLEEDRRRRREGGQDD